MQGLGGVLSVIWRGIVFVLLAIVAVISIPLTLIFLPLRKLFTGESDAIDPDALAEYEGVTEAMKSGDIEALKSLSDALPTFPDGQDNFIKRPWLTNAVDLGTPEVVRWILEQGVDPNYEDEEGFSPLKNAVTREGDEADALKILELLIASSADVNAAGTLSETALHTAAAHGSEAMIRLLLKHGADPRACTTDTLPKQPADWADDMKRPEIAQLLRDHAAAGSSG